MNVMSSVDSREMKVGEAVDELWYKDAIIYQLHVKSFFDADNDGIGDFVGLTEKLDYIRDLGVTAIWVMPTSTSPSARARYQRSWSGS